jgi:hypothetical protein
MGMTADEVDQALRNSHVPAGAQETDEQAKARVLGKIEAILREEHFTIVLNINKVAVKMSESFVGFVDTPSFDIAKERVQIARPDNTAAINDAIKKTSMKLVT